MQNIWRSSTMYFAGLHAMACAQFASKEELPWQYTSDLCNAFPSIYTLFSKACMLLQYYYTLESFLVAHNHIWRRPPAWTLCQKYPVSIRSRLLIAAAFPHFLPWQTFVSGNLSWEVGKLCTFCLLSWVLTPDIAFGMRVFSPALFPVVQRAQMAFFPLRKDLHDLFAPPAIGKSVRPFHFRPLLFHFFSIPFVVFPTSRPTQPSKQASTIGRSIGTFFRIPP